MKKMILLNPGPCNVTNTVRKALMAPDICHRESEFYNLLRDTRSLLLEIFGIKKTHTVALLAGSGTSALESMLATLDEKNKKVLVLSNGVYGQRLCDILKVHEIPTIILSSIVASFPSLDSIESALKNNASIHAIAMVHHETSSGMLNPLQDIVKLAKKYNKILAVDAISSLAAEKIPARDIDYLCGSSGKCLHGFPGISFVFISNKEAQKLPGKSKKTYSLDLWNTLKNEEAGDTPFTPVVQIHYAFYQALKELRKQGLARRIAEYKKRALFLEKGFQKLGLRFVVPKESRSHVLTALWTPMNVSYETMHDALKKKGFVIYAGQSQLQGKIFRVANLGDIRISDLSRFLRELKKLIR